MTEFALSQYFFPNFLFYFSVGRFCLSIPSFAELWYNSRKEVIIPASPMERDTTTARCACGGISTQDYE
jgi:hypothetical protein